METIALSVFLAGVTVRLAWLGLGLLSLVRLRRESVPLEPRPESVNEAASYAWTDAEFRVSSRIARPVTFGLRRPVVLVPPDFTSLAPSQQTTVAAHELIHVARRDSLRMLFDEVLLSLLWFHPAIWWMVGQIRLSVEQLVDQEVVRRTGVRKPYLEALLKFAAGRPAPLLQPVSPFLKHGHLAERVALLVKEASMSRLRLAASFVIVAAVLVVSGWLTVQAFPLRAEATPALLPSVSVNAAGVTTELGLAEPTSALLFGQQAAAQTTSGQQTRPTVDPKLQQPKPGMPPPPPPPPGKVLRTDPYDAAGWAKSVDDLKVKISADPSNAELHNTLAAFYWWRAYGDDASSPSQKRKYLEAGLAAIDQALQIKPKYTEALVYKNLLLRLQAAGETDQTRQQALLAQADALSAEARQLKEELSWGEIPANAVRVGGNIRPPIKIKDVRPVYPAIAQSARVQGVVIVETVINQEGKVQAVRILRSIPLLDQAALEAVKQWEFVPTQLNGAPIPVVMTATVNFTLDGKSGVPGGVAWGVTGGVQGGVAGGVVGGVVGGVAGAPPPPPPPPPLPPDTVRVGGGIQPPTKLVDVRPVYPPEAQQAKIQGVVIIETVIGKDGKVESARVLRSIPMLDQAAIDAVKQWEFSVTTINGVPVKVVMTLTVNFYLAD